MNRRGFLGLLGKLVTVGAALGVAPEILAPAKAFTVQVYEPTETYLGADWIDENGVRHPIMFSKPSWALAS